MKEYYQMGWTLGSEVNEDYYFFKDNNAYFIRKNTSPIIATLSAEEIVPKLKWTKRLSNGDVIIAQDFENGRTLEVEEMIDCRIPEILSKVHTSDKMRKIMLSQGYKEQTANDLFCNIKNILDKELLKNSDIANVFSYLEKNIPQKLENYYPCHADLHKDNWLLSDSGKLFLVDWEESILADPAIDISFILYRYIPKENWTNWLLKYGVEDNLKYRSKLKWYILLQCLIMVSWYNQKKQFAYMNEWLVFINKIVTEY